MKIVECKSIEEARAALAAGDIPCIHKGYLVASGSATVRAYDSATVRAYDSATVELFVRAVATILSATARVTAADWAVVILQAAATVTAAASVVVVDHIVRSLGDWFDAHGAKRRDDGRVVLMKWVGPHGRSSHGLSYPEGQDVEAPDWDPNPRAECGFGLHACASLRDAEQWKPSADALAVELWVDPADCREPQPTDTFPHKIRFRKAYVARVWDPAKDEATALGR